MENGKEILSKYIPASSVNKIWDFFESHSDLYLKISNKRSTKLGDYRKYSRTKHQISVNYNLNPYQFLLTLLHEMAHYLAFKEFGRRIKPHGKEWKMIFGHLILDYIELRSFPDELIPYLFEYAKNPKASTNGDGALFLKLSSYDTDKDEALKYVFQLETGSLFSFENGMVFQLQEKRRTRYKCINIKNGKSYLIHQNALVYPIKKTVNNEK